jgi:hypothetical protein
MKFFGLSSDLKGLLVVLFKVYFRKILMLRVTIENHSHTFLLVKFKKRNWEAKLELSIYKMIPLQRS